jgi:hypothetical protein
MAIDKKKYPKRVERKIVQQYLQKFKENIRGRCPFNLNTTHEDELWALGQHFGLYTHFLDWTSSPYVALFFALEGHSAAKNRCLWALSDNFLAEIKAKRSGPKIEIIKPLSNDNPRLVSQQGLFLKTPVYEQVETIIENFRSRTPGVSVYKLTFDSKIRYEGLSTLNNMNINKLTLFPDLIGAALHTNYQLEVQPHLLLGQHRMWDKYLERMGKKPIKTSRTPTGWKAEIKGYPISVFVKQQTEIPNAMKKEIKKYFKKLGRTIELDIALADSDSL